MAHWHLGDKEKALQCYQDGVQWLEKKSHDHEEVNIPERDEAAALLGIKQPDKPKANTSPQRPKENKPPNAEAKKK